MRDALRDRFRREYGREPELVARAPGRVNLIGEHTDYSEGLVLPCAIDRATWVAAARRSDGRVRVVSEGYAPGEFAAAAPARRGDWLDYVQGVFFAFAERGLVPGGADLCIASDVPREAGLSSSAALAVAVAAALREAGGFAPSATLCETDGVASSAALSEADASALSARDLARLAHRAESGFVGVQCGIMDQTASALGRRGHALRIDCRSLEVEAIPIAADAGLLLVHSGVERQLAAGAYGERVAECRAALEQACAAGVVPHARALRDFSPADLPALERALEPVPLRRARHVISETARVDRFAAALRSADLAAAGALLRKAMASLRDDFAVSTPELDFLCELGDAQPGCYGSRLTGAGFGGCTLHLVAPAAAPAIANALATAFTRRFARRPRTWTVQPSAGATAESLERGRT